MNEKGTYLIRNFKCWSVLLIAYSTILLIGILYMAISVTYFRILFIIGICLEIGILYFGYYFVYRRYCKMDKIIRLYIDGYVTDDLFRQSMDISPTMDELLILLSERMDKTKILNLSKKQAQYLALQNQINPHFLYNTLESIRSEVLCSGLDEVASMTEALATFFRYTISNLDHFVMLEDELSNIENYYIIQKYRFGDKLSLNIEYEDCEEDISILNLKIPKLILQPIVENAIYHGIEPKIGKGNLTVHIEQTEKRLMIRISDDGMGMDEKKLNELNNKLLTNSLEDIIEPKREKKGGIAIINVNNRIKLLFGEEYGICMRSTKDSGTDVEITLPIIKESI